MHRNGHHKSDGSPHAAPAFVKNTVSVSKPTPMRRGGGNTSQAARQAPSAVCGGGEGGEGNAKREARREGARFSIVRGGPSDGRGGAGDGGFGGRGGRQ